MAYSTPRINKLLDMQAWDYTAPTVPALPTPAQPTPGAVTATTIPLTTPTAANATGYRFQLATDSAFTANLQTSPPQTSPAYTFTGLSAASSYYVRVMLVGNGTTYRDSQYSAARQITTAASSGGSGSFTYTLPFNLA